MTGTVNGEHEIYFTLNNRTNKKRFKLDSPLIPVPTHGWMKTHSVMNNFRSWSEHSANRWKLRYTEVKRIKQYKGVGECVLMVANKMAKIMLKSSYLFRK